MTPRRALKSLLTLARARDLELNDLKRAAALAADRLARADAMIQALETALAEEADMARSEPNLMADYGRYAGRAKQRIAAFAATREALVNDVDVADARVLDGFRALKQIEEAADKRRDEIDETEARKERAVADDLAAIRATRRW